MFNAFRSNIVLFEDKLSFQWLGKRKKSHIWYKKNALGKHHQFRGFKSNAIQFNNRQTVRIVDDRFNHHVRLNANYHALSSINVVVFSLYLFGREIYIALLLLLYFEFAFKFVVNLTEHVKLINPKKCHELGLYELVVEPDFYLKEKESQYI